MVPLYVGGGDTTVSFLRTFLTIQLLHPEVRTAQSTRRDRSCWKGRDERLDSRRKRRPGVRLPGKAK